MNLNNKIGWCDATWNPYHGCENHCEFCYARKLAEGRLKGRFGYENGFAPTFNPDRLQEPYHRKTPTKIFVSSMGDLFGDWMLPGNGDFGSDCINRILKVVDDNPQHTFQFLTKYPQNLRALLDYQRDNMWVGTTVTISADMWRVDKLQRNVSGTRFVSFEPLLGHIGTLDFRGIDLVIIGAETGNHPNKVSPEFIWVSWITNAAEQSDVPVYHKDNLLPHVPDLYVLKKNFPIIGGENNV
jgi:protein gp37